MPVWEQRFGRIRRPWYFHIEKHMIIVGDGYEPVGIFGVSFGLNIGFWIGWLIGCAIVVMVI